jgi:hypothetical protein
MGWHAYCQQCDCGCHNLQPPVNQVGQPDAARHKRPGLGCAVFLAWGVLGFLTVSGLIGIFFLWIPITFILTAVWFFRFGGKPAKPPS